MFFYQTHSPVIIEIGNHLISIIKLNIFGVSFTKTSAVLLFRPRHSKWSRAVQTAFCFNCYVYFMAFLFKPCRKVSLIWIFLLLSSAVWRNNTGRWEMLTSEAGSVTRQPQARCFVSVFPSVKLSHLTAHRGWRSICSGMCISTVHSPLNI